MNFHDIRKLMALLIGVLAIMLGLSYQGAILGVRGAAYFNDVQIGVISSISFVGFLIGSLLIPHSVNRVGHVRCFAAMAAIFSATILVFPLYINIWSWSILQFISGFALAGMFVIAESWLNDVTENNNRGILLASYMVICMLGKIAGYNVIGIGDIESYAHFTAISIVVSLAGVPMLLSAGSSPTLNPPEALGLRALYKVSPAGIITVTVNAIIIGLINGYGPTYGVRIGLSENEIGLFLSTIMLGAMVCQVPLGRFSDRVDRRYVISALCIVCIVCSSFLAYWNSDHWSFWILLFLFGASSFTIYSLGCAHTNDFLRPSQRVAASGGLVLSASIGMAIGPVLGGVSASLFGNVAFFAVSGLCSFILVFFVMIRVWVREAPAADQNAEFVPIHSQASVAGAEMVALESELSQTPDSIPDDKQ